MREKLGLQDFLYLAFQRTSRHKKLDYNDWDATGVEMEAVFKDTYGATGSFSTAEIAVKLEEFSAAAQAGLAQFVPAEDAAFLAGQIVDDMQSALIYPPQQGRTPA